MECCIAICFENTLFSVYKASKATVMKYLHMTHSFGGGTEVYRANIDRMLHGQDVATLRVRKDGGVLEGPHEKRRVAHRTSLD